MQRNQKYKSILTNLLVRSGTSVGANIREAFYVHGKAAFIAKLQIALKECSESEYDNDKTILKKGARIKRTLSSSINTAKENQERKWEMQTFMKGYQDFTGTITKKSRSILFGCKFTLQNDTDTIRVSVSTGIYDTFSEGTQLRIGHIGKRIINIRPAEELSQDSVLWNSFIDTLCFADEKKIRKLQ